MTIVMPTWSKCGGGKLPLCSKPALSVFLRAGCKLPSARPSRAGWLHLNDIENETFDRLARRVKHRPWIFSKTGRGGGTKFY